MLIPVALVFGQDDIFGRDIGEDSDRRQLTARLPVFIQRVIVIVHLVNSDNIRKERKSSFLVQDVKKRLHIYFILKARQNLRLCLSRLHSVYLSLHLNTWSCFQFSKSNLS